MTNQDLRELVTIVRSAQLAFIRGYLETCAVEDGPAIIRMLRSVEDADENQVFALAQMLDRSKSNPSERAS